MYYDNNASNHGDPVAGTDQHYKFLKSTWKDGSPIRNCGNGDDTALATCTPETFMFPGNPITKQGWSEFNIFPGTGAPRANAPNDRRFLISTGPFTINPGDEQTIVYGIVWARGGTNLGSVTALGRADNQAQLAFDNNFILPDPPAAPRVNKAEQNKEVILSWYYDPTDNNFQNGYRAPLSVAGQQTFYTFEGFNIFRYPNEAFNAEEGELIATYDRINGVTQIIEDNDLGTTSITANGSDNGLQYSIRETGLTNYKKYYYGVQAYAYNGSTPVEKILRSQVTRITVTPQPTTARNGGTQDVTGNAGRTLSSTRAATALGQGSISASVIDPTRITGDSYRVQFYNYSFTFNGAPTTVLAYDIVNVNTGVKIFDGRAFANRTGLRSPQRADEVGGEGGGAATLATGDGLQFFIGGPAPGYIDFQVTRNAAGPLNPPDYGAADLNHRGFPRTVPTTSPYYDGVPGRNQSTNNARWGVHTANVNTAAAPTTDTGYAYFLSRTTRDGLLFASQNASDFEYRFTAAGSTVYNYFTDGAIYQAPFEVWDVGTKPDASDDVRLIPLINPIAGGVGNVFDLGEDHPTSGAFNDPQTDWVYAVRPLDGSPGQAGYNKWVTSVNTLGVNWDGEEAKLNPAVPTGLDEVISRLVFVNQNGGTVPGPYNALMPETGTIFKLVTAKPNSPGDIYTIATDSVSASVGVDSLFQASIDRIGISPNPYRGASNYETSNLQDAARFTGLPERATIRIFTLSGTLIRTLRKSGPDRFLEWDLQTENALPIASGMYLIHVDVLDTDGKSIGEKVIKFGVVKKRIQLDLL